MNIMIAVFVGGGVGSLLRYFSGLFFDKAFGTSFPHGTLFVNVLGSFLMGFLLVILAEKTHLSPELKSFLTVGFLGGFTTFSAFSADVLRLFETSPLQSALYIFLSVVFSLGAIFLSFSITKGILS